MIMALDDLGDYKPQPHPVEYDLGAVPITTPQEMVDQSYAARPFRELDDMPPCCLEALGNATENLAVLARDLFAKAEATLDEAKNVAMANHEPSSLSKASVLLTIAKAYLELAEATA